MATVNGKMVGVLLNRVDYHNEDDNIVSFKEALAENKENFMWNILRFMDVLYKVIQCC